MTINVKILQNGKQKPEPVELKVGMILQRKTDPQFRVVLSVKEVNPEANRAGYGPYLIKYLVIEENGEVTGFNESAPYRKSWVDEYAIVGCCPEAAEGLNLTLNIFDVDKHLKVAISPLPTKVKR